jgi:hypothetical protein
LKRRAAALGIKDDGLIFTEEQIAAKQQQAQQQQMAEKVAPNVVKAISDHSLAAQQAQAPAAQGEQV